MAQNQYHILKTNITLLELYLISNISMLSKEFHKLFAIQERQNFQLSFSYAIGN